MQPRRKWTVTRRDLCAGDVVLMRDESQHRNNWPLGRVVEAIRSEDDRDRKVKVEVLRDRERKTYLRPIKELVLLLPDDGMTIKPSLSQGCATNN